MRTPADTKCLRNHPSPSATGDNLRHKIAEQIAARARLAQTARAHHAELAARPPASPDDELYDTEYRCEDCGKILEGDDLNFDGDGITLCKFHYEYLLAETAAMSDEEYREMYENLFGWPEADEHSEVPDGPAGLDEDGAK